MLYRARLDSHRTGTFTITHRALVSRASFFNAHGPKCEAVIQRSRVGA